MNFSRIFQPIDAIDRYFGISKKQSSLKTEVLAGTSTFLALSFIFVVNPAILAEAGIDRNTVLFASVVCSAAGTLAIGLLARLPFVVAPGMEMNSYVAFFVVGALSFRWQQALGAVFWSGVLFLALTVSRIRERVMRCSTRANEAGLICKCWNIYSPCGP